MIKIISFFVVFLLFSFQVAFSATYYICLKNNSTATITKIEINGTVPEFRNSLYVYKQESMVPPKYTVKIWYDEDNKKNQTVGFSSSKYDSMNYIAPLELVNQLTYQSTRIISNSRNLSGLGCLTAAK